MGRMVGNIHVRELAIRRSRRKPDAKPVIDIEEDLSKVLAMYPVNEDVVSSLTKGREVLLIDSKGEMKKERIKVEEALVLAKKEGQDIMLVSSGGGGDKEDAAKAPVVRMVNFAEWKEQKRVGLVANKSKQFTEVSKPKEMRFSINITEHDAGIKCNKITAHMQQGYAVHMVLFFAPPIPYEATLGEEFLTRLLERIPDEAGSCSEFKHSPKTGEISVELTPAGGVAKGRTIYKKKT